MSRLAVWITLVLTGYIIGIIQIYGIYRLYSMKNLLIIQKRYPQLVFFEAVVSTVYLLISYPFVLDNILEINLFGGPYSLIFTVFGYCTYSYLSHATANAEAARLWLIYFDLNYLHSIKNESWKSIINITQKKDDWFLQNKNKYGNTKWVILRVLIYYLITATISCLLWILFGTFHITYIIDGCLYALPLIIVIYVYYKSPKHDKDNFLFQYEFTASTILFVIAIPMYLSAQIVFVYNVYISHVITAIISLSPCLLSLISTIWIPYKILSKSEWNQHSKTESNEYVMSAIINASPTNGNEPSKSSKSNNESTIDTKLLDTLKNQNDLESFVDHISHEFSSEVILSFIEFVQYKKYFKTICYNQYENNLESSRCSISKSYDLDDTIPKSSIVYGVVDIDKPFENEKQLKIHIKNSAYLLYKKYISVGSKLEVNISSTLRHYYYDMMNNYDIWMQNDEIDLVQLITLFDRIMNEMFLLMSQAFFRFTYNS